MAVRKIPVKTGSVRGTTPDGEPYESTLERDLYALLRFDPTVKQFTAQPLTIDFVDVFGVVRQYTPDVLIEYHPIDGPDGAFVLGEVKPLEIADDPDDDIKERFAAGDRHAKTRGWTFKVFTEREIRTPLLKNAHFLVGFLNRIPTADAQQQVLGLLQEMGTTTVGALLNRSAPGLPERAATLPVIWHLISHRTIIANLELELDMNTTIRLAGEAKP